MHPLSLDHITVGGVTPPELVRIAAACGCTAVNMKIRQGMASFPLPYDMLGDPAMQRETKRRAADAGITIGVVESFVLQPDTKVAEFERGLAVAAEIGARAANIICFDADRARRADTFVAFCALAARHGLKVTAEFFARSELNSLEAATDLARAAPGAAVNVDILHVVRCGNTVAQVRDVAPSLFGWSQISDGPLHMPVERQEHEARYERQLPGTSEFPLRDFIQALPPDLPIGIEVPAKPRLDAGLDAEAWAKEAVDTSRRLLEGWGVALTAP